jgi:site-specific DNA recombinase
MTADFNLHNLIGVPDVATLHDGLEQLRLGDILGDTVSLDEIPPGSRAVAYLRVSSEQQTRTSYDAHGQSIPAQRVACQRKADELGVTIIDEYIEPGKSATEMSKRPAFRQMLARIQQQGDVDYVIVYMMSRMARNRYDDALVGIALKKMGVTLVSATERIDETPTGQLMQGMLAVINEYQSKASGADIAYKMGEKVKRGGSVGRAPIGYLNTMDTTEGRQIRTVVPDPERAPFIRLAFELYSTGEYSIGDLVDELTDRGLMTRRTPKRPSTPVSTNKMHQLLRDRYYLGYVNYKGEEFPGRHEALVDEELFEKVQGIVKSRGYSAERRREHHHYLKGTVYCGECWTERGIEQRLVLQRAKGRNGGEYFYFFCPNKRNGCSQPFHNVWRIEDAIEDFYKAKHYDPEFLDALRSLMIDTVSNQDEAQRLLRNQLKDQLASLDAQEENLLDLLGDPDVPNVKIKARLRTIKQERERLAEQLGGVELNLTAGARYIEASLALLENAYELYLEASDEVRRRLNQAIYHRFFISDENITDIRLNEPHGHLFATQAAFHAAKAGQENDAILSAFTTAFATAQGDKRKAAPKGGLSNSLGATTAWAYLFTADSSDGVSNKPPMVDPRGFEPLTSSMRTRRATNCAKGP